MTSKSCGGLLEDRDARDDDGLVNDNDDDGMDDSDIYIMMKCLSVCLSRKIITSSQESPLTTCNHP